MTRRSIYALGLATFLLAAALTVASITLPQWLAYTSPPPSSGGARTHVTYGLHSRCSSLTSPRCQPFPTQEDCRGSDGRRTFCVLWRTVGFVMNLAVVVELAAAVGFVVTLTGGRGKREGGWKMVSGLCVAIAGLQIVAMAIVAYLNNNDPRFEFGWRLDTSMILCTLSWIVLLVNAGAITAASNILPPEDDYEPIE